MGFSNKPYTVGLYCVHKQAYPLIFRGGAKRLTIHRPDQLKIYNSEYFEEKCTKRNTILKDVP